MNYDAQMRRVQELMDTGMDYGTAQKIQSLEFEIEEQKVSLARAEADLADDKRVVQLHLEYVRALRNPNPDHDKNERYSNPHGNTYTYNR